MFCSWCNKEVYTHSIKRIDLKMKTWSPLYFIDIIVVFNTNPSKSDNCYNNAHLCMCLLPNNLLITKTYSYLELCFTLLICLILGSSFTLSVHDLFTKNIVDIVIIFTRLHSLTIQGRQYNIVWLITSFTMYVISRNHVLETL